MTTDINSLLTPRHSLVVSLLLGEELVARELRKQLAEHGIRQSAPSFYLLMQRMLAAGLVQRREVQCSIGEAQVTQHFFSATAHAKEMLLRTKSFFEALGPEGTNLVVLA